MNYWLLKTEPGAYSYADLAREGRTLWDGVRNPQARAYLTRMRPGDRALIYHTGRRPAVVGVARVLTGPLPDPTDPTGRWVAVGIAPCRPLPAPVPLTRLRGEPGLAGWELLRLPRLSVVPVAPAWWHRVLVMAQTAGTGGAGPEAPG